jgi:Uma2 family endonuclease
MADEIDPRWQRPLTVAQYHRMIDARIFDEDEKLEMLEGFLIAKSPQEPPHAHPIRFLTRLFSRGLSDDFDVRIQMPLTLARSEPEPDVAVADQRRPWPRHPETAFLVVEVASSSLKKDLGVKAAIYAEAGVVEYWVVNVDAGWVEVLRDPDPAARRYATRDRVSAPAELVPVALPGITVRVADLCLPR